MEICRNPIIRIVLSLAVLLSAAAYLPGVEVDGKIEQGEYRSAADFAGGDFTFSWDTDGKMLFIGISAKTTGWVSIGFEPVTIMDQADMVFGWVEGETAYALDCFSVDIYGPHPPDTDLGGTSDITAFAGSESDGTTVFEFSRPLASSDEYDKTIDPERATTIIWAYGYSDDYTEYHARAGFGTMVFEGGAKAPFLPIPLLMPIHAILMSMALLLFLTGILVAKYGKKKKWWLKVHKSLEMTGGAFSLLGLASGIYMVRVTSGIHLRVLHTWVAVVTLVLLFAVPVIAQLFLKSKLPASTKKILRPLHRWGGRTALILMIATVVLGLMQAGLI